MDKSIEGQVSTGLSNSNSTQSMLMQRRGSSIFSFGGGGGGAKPPMARRDSTSSQSSGKSFNSTSGGGSLASRFNFKSSRTVWKSMKSDNSLLNNLGRPKGTGSGTSGYSTRRGSICVEPNEHSIAEV